MKRSTCSCNFDTSFDDKHTHESIRNKGKQKKVRNPYCNYKINTHKELTKNLELEKSCYYTQRKKIRKYRRADSREIEDAGQLHSSFSIFVSEFL